MINSKEFKTFIEQETDSSIDFYQWLSISISGLGVSHNEFWDMPFFMVVDLVKRISPTKQEMTRKEVLNSMRRNKKLRGWV